MLRLSHVFFWKVYEKFQTIWRKIMIKIFSDESGSWKNKKNYYVRAWIKIDKDNYDNLIKEVLFSKYKLKKTTELKWDDIKRNYDKYRNILEIPSFHVFITISKPVVFFERCYKVIDYLSSDEVENHLGAHDANIKLSLKETLVSSAQNSLFLHHFERHHIRTAKMALVETNSNEEYEFLIDSPQFFKNQWEKVVKEEGIKNINIVEKSENYPGIQIADIIAGCFQELLSNDSKAKEIFAESIKNKMCDMYCPECPNPNIIFNEEATKNLHDRIKQIRDL
jgi:hypothetical protein